LAAVKSQQLAGACRFRLFRLRFVSHADHCDLKLKGIRRAFTNSNLRAPSILVNAIEVSKSKNKKFMSLTHGVSGIKISEVTRPQINKI
jgi:hypothetical protein